MAIPYQATSDDAVSIISYLKTKPTGATIGEARAILKKEILNWRKLNAFDEWDLVKKDGERLKLTDRGWNYARNKKSLVDTFREIIDGIPAYRSAVEWIHHQQHDEVTNVDIASLWHEHHSNALGTGEERIIKDQAVCFFRVCEAAEYGEMVVGRKGAATRLRVLKEAIAKHIESGPSSPPWSEESDSQDVEEVSAPGNDLGGQSAVESDVAGFDKDPAIKRDNLQLRVFISHGKNTDLVEQVETMLGLADIPSEIAVKEETAAIPVPDKVFNAMRKCTAGIIIVSAEQSSDEKYGINQNVLIEIGAAFVLYDKKVVLLWDKRIPVPSNLQGLYRCEFEGEDLNWGAGMKLMKAIKGFK